MFQKVFFHLLISFRIPNRNSSTYFQKDIFKAKEDWLSRLTGEFIKQIVDCKIQFTYKLGGGEAAEWKRESKKHQQDSVTDKTLLFSPLIPWSPESCMSRELGVRQEERLARVCPARSTAAAAHLRRRSRSLSAGAGPLPGARVGTAQTWLRALSAALMLLQNTQSAALLLPRFRSFPVQGGCPRSGWAMVWVPAASPLREPTLLPSPFWAGKWDWWQNCYYYRKKCGSWFCFKNPYLRYLWNVWMASR